MDGRCAKMPRRSTENMNPDASTNEASQLKVTLKDASRCGNPGCSTPRPRHKCARCMSICYCSKDCQLSHYPEHKAICKTIAHKFCRVNRPSLIGFDPRDPEEQAIAKTLTEQSHEANEKGERFFPLLLSQHDLKHAVDARGEYVGLPASAETISQLLQAGNLRRDTTYNIPLFCGVARLCLKPGPNFVPYVPKTVPICASQSKARLADLLAWRRSSMQKRREARGSHKPATTPMDNANLVLELLCLLDKTVFPTLQLFRALRQKGALIVQAENHELSWRFVPAQDLRGFGREVRQCLESYDVDSAVVTLTSGTCVDKSKQATVLMLTPLHVSQAFHEQQVDDSVTAAVGGGKAQELKQCSLLYKLISRQKAKLSQCTAQESEA